MSAKFYIKIISLVRHSFLTLKIMDKKVFCVSIKQCFVMGKNTVEIKRTLDEPYGDSVQGKSTIIDLYAELKHGRTNTGYAERVAQKQQSF